MVEVIDKDVSCCARPSTDITYHMKFINIQTVGIATKLSEA